MNEPSVHKTERKDIGRLAREAREAFNWEAMKTVKDQICKVKFLKPVSCLLFLYIYILCHNSSPGSVVVKYRIGWTFKEGIRNPPDPVTADSLKNRLESHLRSTDGFLYNYRLPLHSLQAESMLLPINYQLKIKYI